MWSWEVWSVRWWVRGWGLIVFGRIYFGYASINCVGRRRVVGPIQFLKFYQLEKPEIPKLLLRENWKDFVAHRGHLFVLNVRHIFTFAKAPPPLGHTLSPRLSSNALDHDCTTRFLRNREHALMRICPIHPTFVSIPGSATPVAPFLPQSDTNESSCTLILFAPNAPAITSIPWVCKHRKAKYCDMSLSSESSTESPTDALAMPCHQVLILETLMD